MKQVIQIRGANGSGKSTIVRKMMDHYKKQGLRWTKFFEKGRKKPIYYCLKREDAEDVYLLGHYESNCGGCDTITGNEKTFELQQRLSKKGIVIAEGIMLSEDVKWAKQLTNLKILFIDVRLETCLKRICKRRESSGNDKPFIPTRAIRRYNDFLRVQKRLVAEGLSCEVKKSNEVFQTILEWIG